MRKTRFMLISILLIAVLLVAPVIANAAENDGYSIELNYAGNVYVNEEKVANVTLKGDDTATTYTNVRMKVDVEGPATPKLLATDTLGTEWDLAQIGYWGSEGGFEIKAGYDITTPIKATFPEAGKYTITLSLVDVNNAEKVIVSKTVEINVGVNVSTGDKLVEAINNAKDGDTITLTNDVTLTTAIEVADKNITINGNGFTIKGSADLVGVASPNNKTLVTALYGAKINLVNVKLEDSPKYGVQAYDGAHVVLDGVTISNCNYGGVLANGGTIEIVDLNLEKNGTTANNGIEISTSKYITSGNVATLIMNGKLSSTETENVIYFASDENDNTTEMIIENTESTTDRILVDGNKVVVANENNEVKYVSNESDKVVIDGDELPKTVTVTINVMGATKEITFEVEEGTILTAKDLESKIDLKALGMENYTLDGFYADSRYSEKFDFEKAIEADTTIYAKVAKVDEKPGEKPDEKPEEPTDKPEEKPDGDDEIVQTGDYIYIAIGALVLVVAANVGYAVIKRNHK